MNKYHKNIGFPQDIREKAQGGYLFYINGLL